MSLGLYLQDADGKNLHLKCLAKHGGFQHHLETLCEGRWCVQTCARRHHVAGAQQEEAGPEDRQVSVIRKEIQTVWTQLLVWGLSFFIQNLGRQRAKCNHFSALLYCVSVLEKLRDGNHVVNLKPPLIKLSASPSISCNDVKPCSN